jgi:hypothetical protein
VEACCSNKFFGFNPGRRASSISLFSTQMVMRRTDPAYRVVLGNVRTELRTLANLFMTGGVNSRLPRPMTEEERKVIEARWKWLEDLGFRLVSWEIDVRTKKTVSITYEYNPPLIEEIKREREEVRRGLEERNREQCENKAD